MQGTGLLVTAWPIVLGCDAGGSVVKAGAKTTFKPGDRVFGCTRLGVPGHSTFQEYHLMDAVRTVLIPDALSYLQGSSLGVGTFTACLGLFQGLKLEQTATPKDDWIVILGGAGSVGQYSIQIAKAVGYKVVATCSKRSNELVSSLGADALIDYSLGEDDLLAELGKITGGRFFGVWDSVAKSEKLGRRAVDEVSTYKGDKPKTYGTTDDWTPMEKYDTHATYRVELGMIGRSVDEMKANGMAGDYLRLNEDLADYCVFIADLLKQEKVKPNPVLVIKGGLDAVPEAVTIQQKGTKGGEKVVVEIVAQ